MVCIYIVLDYVNEIELEYSSPREYNCTKNTKHCSRKKRQSPKKEQPSPPKPAQPFYLHLRITGQVADIKLFSGDLGSFDVPTDGILDSGTLNDVKINDMIHNSNFKIGSIVIV